MDKLENKQSKRHSGKEAARITDECLQEALLKLLKEKNIDKITVKELTSLAGVSRSSFYRRYDEPMDLLKEIIESYVTDMLAVLNSEKYRENPREWYYEVFKFASQNADALLKSVKIDAPDGERVVSLTISNNIFVCKTVLDYYTNLAMECALSAIIFDWLYYGMKESPEEMADIAYNIFKNYIPSLFEKVPE